MGKKGVILSLLIALFISMFSNSSVLVYATENENKNENDVNKVYEDDINGHAEDSASKDKIEVMVADIEAPVLDVSSIKVNRKNFTVGDNVKVSLKASDDNSGIKYAWIYYKTPQTNRTVNVSLDYNSSTGLYEGNLIIDNTIESGKWEIDWIYLSDNQGNYINYDSNDYNLSNGSFNVTGTTTDIIAPVLDISSIKVNKKNFTVGDNVKVSLKASDDNSGIKYAWIYYKTPQTNRTVNVSLGYNSSTGLYEGNLIIDNTIESGKWEIDWIYLSDNQGNYINYDSNDYNLSNGSFNVTGTTTDIIAPVLDISSIKVNKKNFTVGDNVKVSLKASDDNSGIKYAWVYYKTPQTNRTVNVSLDYNSSTGLYEGNLIIDNTMESGKWEIDWIYLSDNQGNYINYDSSHYDLSNGIFNVKDSENNYESIEGVTVVTKNEIWSNKTINGDVYIGPEAVLQINGNVNITGNIYVLGALKSYGGLNLSGTLQGRSTSFGGNPTLYNGTIVINGSNYITEMKMTTYPVIDIPVRIDEIAYVSTNKILIKGATLKVADMYIDGQLVTLDYKGRFSLDNIDVKGKEKITISFITIFGNTITKEIDIPKNSDVNGDGVIDILDVSLVAKNYNKSNSDSGWNSKFDFNNDRIIDIFDIVSISNKM